MYVCSCNDDEFLSDFKKRELHKYEAIHSKSPDTTKLSITGFVS